MVVPVVGNDGDQIWVGGPTLAKSIRLSTCFAFELQGKRGKRMIKMQS